MDIKPTIGISLSGGGARGIAHLGVLEALREHDIHPEVIAGTSAGAIVGALYACGKKPREMLEFVKDTTMYKVFKVVLPSGGLTNLSYLRERLDMYIEEDSFEDLKKKLFVAITNLNTGKLEIISAGPLYDVVIASSSIPLMFKPLQIGDDLYVDGGLLCNMPVEPLIPHANFLIGVNVMPHAKVDTKTVSSVLGISARCFELALLSNTLPQAALCNVVIEPKAVHDIGLFQFNKQQELYDIGYQAAMDKIGDIKAGLERCHRSLNASGSAVS